MQQLGKVDPNDPMDIQYRIRKLDVYSYIPVSRPALHCYKQSEFVPRHR